MRSISTRVTPAAARTTGASCCASCDCAPCARRSAAAPWYVRDAVSGRSTGLTPDGLDPVTWGRASDREVTRDTESAAVWDNMGPEERADALERIGKAAGESDLATARLVRDLVGRGFDAVQAYLRGEQGIEIARIGADRDIALARLRARTPRTDDPPPPPPRDTTQPVTIASDSGGGVILAGLALLLLAAGKRR